MLLSVYPRDIQLIDTLGLPTVLSYARKVLAAFAKLVSQRPTLTSWPAAVEWQVYEVRPPIMQSNADDCGVLSLCYVLKRYHCKTDI